MSTSKSVSVPKIKSLKKLGSWKKTSLPFSIESVDPEILKRAIEHFSEFKDLAVESISALKDFSFRSIESSENSQIPVYESYQKLIDYYAGECKRTDISAEERSRYEGLMRDCADQMSLKDTEHKQFTQDTIKQIARGLSTVLTAAIVVLGGNVSIKRR